MKDESIEVENIEKKGDNIPVDKFKNIKYLKNSIYFLCLFFSSLLAYAFYGWHQSNKNLSVLKSDLNIISYKPSQKEIQNLEGLWMCYTGSPQARSSDDQRYHMVVYNIIEMKYKNGYFVYNRYGASFNHEGYAQYESPGLVSIHSHVKNPLGNIESPRHTLIKLDTLSSFIPAISASWNFDTKDKNKIIGIREVYKKLGKLGKIEEIINTVDNASCKCKIIKWTDSENKSNTFYLKNQFLDSLSEPKLMELIDENSIILREPQEGVVLTKK